MPPRSRSLPLPRLECWCKGELALTHRDCAIKWFSIKGNGNCDVCIHSTAAAAAAAAASAGQNNQTDTAAAAASSASRYRVWQWHGTPILVIISMLAYFCFRGQLLVGDHGTAALAISLPFACVLGLFSSLTTTKLVSRRYVWIYSAVQFLFIVLFTHLFYRYRRMPTVIAIILSTFAGLAWPSAPTPSSSRSRDGGPGDPRHHLNKKQQQHAAAPPTLSPHR